MSIISKSNRNGVDVAIESLQQRLYPKLLAYWDGSAVYSMYPRANKNHIDAEIHPQISLDEKDYQDVLFNDKFSVTSFFIVDNTRGYSNELGQTTHTVSLIFQADLVALYGQTNRADEQFNMDVLRELSRESLYINVDQIQVTETPNAVYSDFTFNQGTFDKLRIQDFSQHHVVRFDFDITYRINCVPSVVPVCSPVTITENGSFLEFVPSGGTFNYNTTADPAGNILNGTTLTDIVSGTTKTFLIQYEDLSPLTITTVSDNATLFSGTVPKLPSALNTSTITKTGSATSINSGDDADIQRGRGVDFYNVSFTNPFGHSKAFTGTTGGYYDEGTSQYKDVDGVVTTEASAFPDGLILNWKTYTPVTGDVFCMDYNFLQTGSVASMISAAPYTRGGFGDFYACNFYELMSYYQVGSVAFNWAPISFNVGGGGTVDRVYSSSYSGGSNYHGFVSSFVISSLSSSASCTIFLGRYLNTTTDLGL